MNHNIIAKINNDSVVFFENEKEFIIKNGYNWSLNIYDDHKIMLVIHRPYTVVDYFDTKPAKITYNDTLNCVQITRINTSYTFEFNDTDEYVKFKNLKLEEIYYE